MVAQDYRRVAVIAGRLPAMTIPVDTPISTSENYSYAKFAVIPTDNLTVVTGCAVIQALLLILLTRAFTLRSDLPGGKAWCE